MVDRFRENPDGSFTNLNPLHPGTYKKGELLGRGTYGEVYASDAGRILKIINNSQLEAFTAEVTLQRELFMKDSRVCPAVYTYGRVANYSDKFVMVMERFDGTVASLFDTKKDTDLLLEWLTQTADILIRLRKFQFNHRDLKPDNMMYKRQANGSYLFVLIDFGFACATIDGRVYKGGVNVYRPDAECFRGGRDMSMLIVAFLMFNSSGFPSDIIAFLKSLLTLKRADGSECKVYDLNCPIPGATVNNWEDTYRYFDNPAIKNPNTTPEGVKMAIEAFKAEHPLSFLARLGRMFTRKGGKSGRRRRRRKQTRR